MSNPVVNNTSLVLQRARLRLSIQIFLIFLLLSWSGSVIADVQPSQQDTSQRLTINYSLAKAFEEKSSVALLKAKKLFKDFDYIAAQTEFRSAFLYALEAQRWPLPKDKIAISAGSLQQLLDIKEHTLSSELLQTSHYIPDYDEPAVPAENLNGHSDAVYDIAYSPDGRFLASVSSDETIRIWDTKTSKTIRTIKNGGFVSKLAYSPHGRRIVTVFDKNIRIWDSLTGKLLHTLEGHTESIHDIAYSPDGKTIASNAGDNTLRLWDADSGVLNKIINIEQVTDIAFNPDGETIIASQTWAGEVAEINLQSGKTARTLEKTFDKKVAAIVYSPDGKTIAGGLDYSSSTTILWDADSGEVRSLLVDFSTRVRSLAFSSDGTTLASSYFPPASIHSKDQDHHFIAVWDISTAKKIRAFGSSSGSANSITFSPDGKVIAASSEDGAIRFWGMQPPDIDNITASFEFSPDSKRIVRVADNTIQIRDATTGLIKLEIVGDRDNPYRGTPKFSRDGQTIAVIVTDRTFNIYDTKSGDLLQSRSLKEGTIYGFTYKPDGKALGVRLNTAEEHFSTPSEKYPNKLLILDIQTGDETVLMTKPNPGLLQLTFSHDGKMIAALSPSTNGNINIWETTSGKLIKTHSVDSGQSIREIVFSPDNSKIIYQSNFFERVGEFQDVTNKYFVKVFDIKTGNIVDDTTFCIFYSDMNGCTLAFTADGKRFVTSEARIRVPSITTVRDTQNFTVLKQFSHEESTLSAFSSPDGNSIFIPTINDQLDIIRLDKPVYRLIYEFDAVEVSDALQFLWELELDGIHFKHSPRAKSAIPQNGRHIVWTDENQKYQPLMERPQDEEGKLDQVVRWLEVRCAYKQPELHACKP